jgi:ABC-type Co2+ transport system permease subunit
VVYLGTQNLGTLIHTGDKGFLALELDQPHENPLEEKPYVDFRRFLSIVLPLGLIGWILESFVSGVLISYLAKEKPDIIIGKT